MAKSELIGKVKLIEKAEKLRLERLEEWKVEKVAKLLKEREMIDLEIEKVYEAKVGEHSPY